ncbi:hypothetical protein J3R74_001461 [Puniceicoccus vermicola]
MDPEKRSRNLFCAVLIIAAIAVGLFKLYLYRSALEESFQTTPAEDSAEIQNSDSGEASTAP